MPEYPTGTSGLYNFFGRNFNFSSEARQKGLHGMAVISFTVDTDGSLTDIKVLRDPGYGSGEEAVRVLKTSKKWIPGREYGYPVKVGFTLPIRLGVDAR